MESNFKSHYKRNKTAGIAMFKSDQIALNLKKVIRGKGGWYLLIRGTNRPRGTNSN